MSSARLLIQVEGGSEARRAFGQISADAKKATDAVAASSRESARKQERDRESVVKAAIAAAARQKKIDEDLAAAREKIIFRANAAIARMNAQRAKQEAAGIASTEKMMAKLAADWVKTEQKKTAATQKEARKRDALEAASATRRERQQKRDEDYHDRSVILSERAAHRREAAESAASVRRAQAQSRQQRRDEDYYDRSVSMAERAARRRAEAEVRSFRARGGELGRSLMGGAIGIGSNVHGQIQDVRARRADTEHSLNAALYQAGAGGGDVRELQGTVFDFARQNGLNSGELAQGINAAQTEFSVLGNSRSSQSDRRANLANQLQLALFARNTGQDTSEVLRVAGMLGNSGLSGTQQRQTLLSLTGMAQRGAIELGSVTRTAMAPMQARIGQAMAGLGPNADAATRQHATQQAVMQTMAEMEVGRGLGYTPRNLGNIMSQLGGSLQSDVTQSKMFTNISAAAGLSSQRRREIQEQLFVTDSHGRHRLRGEYQSGFGLAQGLTQAFHGDSTAMQNVFAGGGQGNPQSLQANWRRVMGAFMGEGNESVGRMMSGAGRDFTEADVGRGSGVFGNEQRAELNKNQEEHDKALGDNTSALNQVSNTIAALVSVNPILSQVAGNVGGNLLTRGAGVAGSGLAGGVAARALGIVGKGAPALLSAAALTTAAGATAALGAGLGAGDLASRAMGAGKGFASGNTPSVFNPATIREAAREFFGLFRSNPPIQVSVDPHTLAQARSATATGANAPSPEQRASTR